MTVEGRYYELRRALLMYACLTSYFLEKSIQKEAPEKSRKENPVLFLFELYIKPLFELLRILGSRDWNPANEDASHPGLALNGNMSAHYGTESAAYGKPKSSAAVFASGGSIGLGERLK